MLERKNNCLDDEKVKKKDTYIWIPAGLTLLVIIALVLFLGCIFLLWVDSNTSDILGGILLIFALGLIALFVKYGIIFIFSIWVLYAIWFFIKNIIFKNGEDCELKSLLLIMFVVIVLLGGYFFYSKFVVMK